MPDGTVTVYSPRVESEQWGQSKLNLSASKILTMVLAKS